MKNPAKSVRRKGADVSPAPPVKNLSIHTLACASRRDTALERVHSYEIVWVKSGDGTLQVDAHTYALAANTFFCLIPGQLRLLKCDKEATGYIVAMSRDFLHLLHDQFEMSFMLRHAASDRQEPLMLQNESAAQVLENLVMQMQKELDNYLQMRQETLKGFLKIFMIYLDREFSATRATEPCDKNMEVVLRFMDLLKQRIASMKLVSDYADELCVTPNYLNFLVKKQTGYTASHHIQQYIIMEAKRQAIYSGLRLKEIADHLGFADHAHFSKFFKNYSGINFSSFKKTLANDMP